MSEIKKEIEKIAKKRTPVSLFPFIGSKINDKYDEEGIKKVISAATGKPASKIKAKFSTPEEAAGYVNHLTGKGSITDIYPARNILTRGASGAIRGTLAGATIGAALNLASEKQGNIALDIGDKALKGAAIGAVLYGLEKPAFEYVKGKIKALKDANGRKKV